MRNSELAGRKRQWVELNAYTQRTFNHLPNLFLVHIVTFGIHKSAKEVLEAVEDFSVGREQRYPVTHRMTLCVLQVINALYLLHTSSSNTSLSVFIQLAFISTVNPRWVG